MVRRPRVFALGLLYHIEPLRKIYYTPRVESRNPAFGFFHSVEDRSSELLPLKVREVLKTGQVECSCLVLDSRTGDGLLR